MLKRFSIFLLLFSVISAMACQYTTPPGQSWPAPTYISYEDEPENHPGCPPCGNRKLVEFNSYIVGINWFTNRFIEGTLYASHDNQSKTIHIPYTNTQVNNSISSGLPITLWMSIHTQEEYEHLTSLVVIDDYMLERIVKSKMYYKVIPSSKSYDDPTCKWRLGNEVEYNNNPVIYSKITELGDRLFGTNTLSKEEITANGDSISSGDKICFVWYILDESGNENIEELEIGKVEPYLDYDSVTYISDKATFGDSTILAAYFMVVTYDGSTIYGR